MILHIQTGYVTHFTNETTSSLSHVPFSTNMSTFIMLKNQNKFFISDCSSIKTFDIDTNICTEIIPIGCEVKDTCILEDLQVIVRISSYLISIYNVNLNNSNPPQKFLAGYSSKLFVIPKDKAKLFNVYFITYSAHRLCLFRLNDDMQF